MDCVTCKEDREPVQIPFIAHESAMLRMEKILKKQWITIMLLICLLVGSNLAWLYYENQFEEVTTTEITQENADGYNDYIGNDGDINNGKADN